MKNLKKLMSVILTVAMLLSMLATSVGAATFADVEEDNAAYEAIEILAALEILEGKEEGNFDPEANIKRSEFAAVICRAMNQEAAASGSAGVAKFTDVATNHWAAGYINWAAGQGIVNGMGDGSFAPDANVTYEQAVAMIVRALGFEPLALKRGGFPTGYMVIAAGYGVTDGVAMSPANAAASRAGVAMLVYNAFNAPLMEESLTMNIYGGTGYNIYDGDANAKKTILSEYHDIWMARATVVDTFRSNPATLYKEKTDTKLVDLKLNDTYKYDYKVFLDGAYTESGLEALLKDNGTKYVTAIADNAAFADFLGYDVNVFLTINDDNDLEVIAMVPDTKNFEMITINNVKAHVVNADDNSGAPIFEYWENLDDSRTEKLDINKNYAVYMNGIKVVDDPTTDKIDEVKAAFNSLDSDTGIAEITLVGDKTEFTKIFITKYDYAVVKSVNARGQIKMEGTMSYLDLSEDNTKTIAYNIYKDGAAIAVADLAEGDLLNIAKGTISTDSTTTTDDRYIYDIYVTNDVVEGSIAYFDPEDASYSIDGTAYYAVSQNVNDKKENVANWKPGSAGAFLITIDGRILDAEVSREFVANYAFILETGKSADSTFEETYQIKLLTKDNVVKVYDLASTLKVEEYDSTDKAYDVYNYKVGGKSGAKDQADLKKRLDDILAKNKETTTKFETATIAGLFITFKAEGDTITAISFPDDSKKLSDETFNYTDLTTADYNKDRSKLGSVYTTDSTVVFSINVDSYEKDGKTNYAVTEDSVQVYTVSSLQDADGVNYSGLAYAVDANTDEVGALVINSGITPATKENALAIVTGTAKGLNAANESVNVLNVFVAGEFVAYPVSDKCGSIAGLSKGDVIQIEANAAGEMDSFIPVFDFDAGKLTGSLAAGLKAGDIDYYAGVVIDDKRGIEVKNASGSKYFVWDLGEGSTNVLFDVDKANTSKAFAGMADNYHISANIEADTFMSEAYVVVLRTIDEEIVDVVAYEIDAYEKAVKTIADSITLK